MVCRSLPGWPPGRPIHAPPGYRWTDEDVQSEHRAGFLNGMLAGMFVGYGQAVVTAVVLAVIW